MRRVRGAIRNGLRARNGWRIEGQGRYHTINRLASRLSASKGGLIQAEHFVGGDIVERLEGIGNAAELRDGGGGGGLGIGGYRRDGDRKDNGSG